MESFRLFHLVLYSKSWYKRFHPKSSRKSIWDDMRILLTADGYQGELMSKLDIINVLLRNCQLLNVRQFADITQIINGIHPKNVWKIGYVTKDHWTNPNDEEYDYYTAVIYYCLSVLHLIDRSTLSQSLPRPDRKVLPLNNGITQKQLDEHFKS